ncbi:murein hydrolase activator EnvC family protein [Dongia deserti]|uniref:murein hydrolase activator EnvC family protein n=1 Tax=Dongia deserti TaxID=2268030 RepID=UPI0013C50E88|nr:peptidoglycan DD-metalloendopeptidase family protein [Dongia deserti]
MTAWAQSPEELRQIQEQINQGKIEATELKKKADELAREVTRLQQSLIRSAAEVQDAESEATELEHELAELSEREKASAADLEQKRAQLSQTLMALERLSLRPAQAAFFSDRTPLDEARAATLMAAATKALDERARQLQSDLAKVRELREVTAARQEELAASVDRLAQENQHLAALLKQKAELQEATLAQSEETKKRQAQLAQQAKSLKDLLDRLEAARAEEEARQQAAAAEAARKAEEAAKREAERLAAEQARQEQGEAPAENGEQVAAVERPAAPAIRLQPPPADLPAFPKQVGGLIRPARGEIAAKFGQRTDAFGEGKGLVIATRAGAQVVTPFDGQIVFEGPFRSYGQILIIEHRGGYHTVLAGLAHVDVVVGQWLKAGEPVGAMIETTQGRPQLYVELRRSGQPFDPAPWFK